MHLDRGLLCKAGWASRGGLGCSPVPGQQLGQTRARPALGHTIDDVGEIGLRVEPVEPSRFDDRVDVCRAQATFVAAQEEEVLPITAMVLSPLSATLLSMARRP